MIACCLSILEWTKDYNLERKMLLLYEWKAAFLIACKRRENYL
ncbi:hypothetical protein HMP0721_1548 [Pseudoramibacter alactolyticus ATCC 23263]|uniref:Uncharacterized protein n=1 Tax=Pseudoramibacter alactolyticus ATCC 23263 TaxID=887929 RepID=E6MHR3_9FIRM|nr:hypothetical protein HMP0721_1548 [Pseudoramibacter alactolyticus ATCC 23263]